MNFNTATLSRPIVDNHGISLHPPPNVLIPLVLKMNSTSIDTSRHLDRFSIVTFIFFVIVIRFNEWLITSLSSSLSNPFPSHFRWSAFPKAHHDTSNSRFLSISLLLQWSLCSSSKRRNASLGVWSEMELPADLMGSNHSISWFSSSHWHIWPCLWVSCPLLGLWLEDLTGILQSAAFWVSNRGGTSGRRLYFYFYLMTTALSAVLGNDPVILSGTAFLVYFTKIAEVSPISWIFSEFVTCNTASMILFVGASDNISQGWRQEIQPMWLFVKDFQSSLSFSLPIPLSRFWDVR